jgi:hypothetical protein
LATGQLFSLNPTDWQTRLSQHLSLLLAGFARHEVGGLFSSSSGYFSKSFFFNVLHDVVAAFAKVHPKRNYLMALSLEHHLFRCVGQVTKQSMWFLRESKQHMWRSVVGQPDTAEYEVQIALDHYQQLAVSLKFFTNIIHISSRVLREVGQLIFALCEPLEPEGQPTTQWLEPSK